MTRNATGKTVLLVEDEEDIVLTLSKRLESWNYRVVTALTGPSGLATAEREKPDAILLDILLPGMSGLAVLEELRRRDPAVAVIVLTALPVRDAHDAVRLGARAVLQKPVESAVLRRELDGLFSPSST